MSQLNTIAEALEDIKKGKVIIVVDDEDRENEGDFVASAELITPEIINFMATHGRGLWCTPLPEERCNELGLELMVGRTTDPKETAFTVSIDLIGNGVTTGISAIDRAMTIKALMDDTIKADDFARPGHIFPLRAKSGGVLRRAGHTEAAVDISILAGLKPGGVIVEILNEDGTMARLPDLKIIAEKFDLKIISIQDLIEYRLQYDSLVEQIEEMKVPSIYGDFVLKVYKQKTTDQVHFAITKGKWSKDEPVLVRVNSSNTYKDIFPALINGENLFLESSFKLIEKEGKGAIIFINNVTSSDVIYNKLSHFKRYLAGKSEKPTRGLDERDLGIGAQIIKDLGIKNLKLITQNPNPNIVLDGYGLCIAEFVKI